MQKIKRPISVILSILMVVSLITILPITASAASTKNFEDKLKVENTTETVAAKVWNWSDTSSGAAYNGKSKATAGNMTFWTDADSRQGFVTTKTGGKAVSVRIDWALNANIGGRKKVYVYGKNTAYSSYTDVFDNANRGTLLNTITVGSEKRETFAISGNYKYIAVRTGVTSGLNDNIYIDNILITWEQNFYDVTWENWDHTVLETDREVAEGKTPTYNGADPEKTGDAQYSYTFSGWSPQVSPVTSDVTYTAQFTQTVNKYTVTWKNGNDVLETDTDVEYGSLPTYEGAVPTMQGDAQYSYTFCGWNDGTKTYALNEALPEVTGDVTFSAQYESSVNKYTVTWKIDEDVIETDTDVEYGAAPKYDGETPAKDDLLYNYTFTGWTDGEKDYNVGEELPAVEGDVTYTATFDVSRKPYFAGYTLSLNGDICLNFYLRLTSGEAETAKINFKWFDKEIDEPTITLDRSGYYKVSCPVAAAEMTYDITALLSIDGKVVAADVYSVKEYADVILSEEFEKDYTGEGAKCYANLKKLIETMLDYGSRAQVRFDRNTDKLANGGVYYFDNEVEVPYNADNMSENLEQYGLRYEYSTVLFLSETSLRHYYTVVDEEKFAEYKDSVTFDNRQVAPVNKNSKIYFEKKNIAAANIDEPYEIKIGNDTYSYSAMDYIHLLIDSNISDSSTELGKATARYNAAANDFFA